MASTERQTEHGPEWFDGLIKLRKMEEILVIPVGSGIAAVPTTTNMWPAGLILSVGVEVVEPPGGGAVTMNVGVTGGANADRLVDGMSCDLIHETATSPQDGDGTVAYPEYNKTATTLDVTLNANVTVSQMRLRIVTTYLEFSDPI